MFNLLSSLMKSGPAVDVADAVKKVDAGKALLVDVREESEMRGGKAKGAVNLPLSRLHQSADPKSGHFDKALAKALKSGAPVYLYCASGARSGRAAGILGQHGFADVHNLGSLRSWHAGGGSITR